MNHDDFEFYRDLPKPPTLDDFVLVDVKGDDPFGLKKTSKPVETESIVDEETQKFIDSCPKKIEKIQKTKVTRKKKKSSKITLSKKAFALVIALTLVFGSVSAKVIKPYVDSLSSYERDRIAIAQLSDSYKVTQDGHLQGLNVIYKQQSLLYDGPGEIDFDNPENVRLDSEGKKVGYAVDYYDGFDKYVAKNNGGKGYYRTVYEMNEHLKKLGMKPQTAGVYSPEELEEMFTKMIDSTYKEESKPTLGGL